MGSVVPVGRTIKVAKNGKYLVKKDRFLRWTILDNHGRMRYNIY